MELNVLLAVADVLRICILKKIKYVFCLFFTLLAGRLKAKELFTLQGN